MNPTIVGIKELHKELSRIAVATAKGASFIVVKHAKPVFRIEPMEYQQRGRYGLEDISRLQRKSGDPHLSHNIDRILYGV